MAFSDILKYFSYADGKKVQEKLTLFLEDGNAKLHFVFDFDRTLTSPRLQDGEDVTTWHILRSYLPSEGVVRYQNLFTKYRSLEISGSLTEADAAEWWSHTLRLYSQYGINMNDVQRTFMSHTTIRPNTRELFGLCEASGIPTVIISAGIRDVIAIWMEKYNIRPSVILSTSLKMSSVGVITGWDHSSLIHVKNKNAHSHSQLTSIREARPNVILIGDGIDDNTMAEGESNVLRIRIFDPRKDEQTDGDAFRRKTFERFDMMIETGTFAPVIKIMELLR